MHATPQGRPDSTRRYLFFVSTADRAREADCDGQAGPRREATLVQVEEEDDDGGTSVLRHCSRIAESPNVAGVPELTDSLIDCVPDADVVVKLRLVLSLESCNVAPEFMAFREPERASSSKGLLSL